MSKTKGAMIYPAIIVIVMVGVVLLMLLFVIPRLRSLYDEMGATLPIMTRMLLGLSELITSYWWLVLIAVAALALVLRKFVRTETGKKAISRLQLKLPIFGLLTKQMQLTSFTRTLSMLISSGLPILQGLEIAKQTMSNQVFQKGTEEAIRAVERGSSLGEEFSHDPNFPSIFSEMVKVGEQTGRLDDVLGDLSQYFESESLRTVDNLSALLEPVIMVILGVGIGFLVISLILPIYSLTSQF